jgi:predicted phosphoribosyltransferase
LAEYLTKYAHRPETGVFGLPRGGVPVAREVARALDLPLDVFIVRKLGVPGHEELAFGAVATGGVRVLNRELIQSLRLPEYVVDDVSAKELAELARRERLYRGNLPPHPLDGLTAILVDDGLATGASMVAAIRAARAGGANKVVVAVPVGPPEAVRQLQLEADEVVCPYQPTAFRAVGLWYTDFSQTSDEEVQAALETASARPPSR